MKEITPIETKLKKYRPESVEILPAFRKNINIVHWFKKQCSKVMIIVGRRTDSLKRGKY
jgi:hypothetical protein